MEKKFYTIEELQNISMEIIDMLRPKHLIIRDIRLILKHTEELLDYVMLREKE